MLKLDGLVLRQADFRLQADMSIDAGTRATIMGPSGAGKSTLLAALGGFLGLEAGDILWNGQSLVPLSPGARPISTIFQDNNLFPHLTLFQNIALGVRSSGSVDKSEAARIEHSLARVGLADMGRRKPGTLSGGQQSRAALARMLMQGRPIVLLDEPFAALGPALRTEMIGLVQVLCDDTGATLLMVSHDPEDARRLGGDLILVADGQVFQPRPAKAALACPDTALAAYLGAPEPP